MRYISLFIGVILGFSSCDGPEVAGGEKTAAGFRDTEIAVFENAGTEALRVDFAPAPGRENRLTVQVVEEMNMEENKDYFFPVKELTVAAGAQSAEFSYTLVDDNVTNGLRSFVVALTAVNGGEVDTLKAAVRVNVLDDESEVAVGFESTAMRVPERETGSGEPVYTCAIPLKVFGTWVKPIRCQVALRPLGVENEAMEQVHVRLTETEFVFDGKTDRVPVPVEITGDGAVDADRIFALEIISVDGAGIYAWHRRCLVTVGNDDMGIDTNDTNIN